MGDRAIAITQVEQISSPAVRSSFLRRAYVPVITALLIVIWAMLLVYEAEPLTAPPPEQRVQAGVNPELSPEEARLADAVIQPGFAPRNGRSQLLFIGNSQTMAIPYAQSWDITTPQWFQVLLSRRHPGEFDVYRASLGGMTFPEVAIRMVEFGNSVPNPTAVIFDLRPEMLGDLTIRNDVRTEARQPVVAASLRNMLGDFPDHEQAKRVLSDATSAAGDSTAAEQGKAWPAQLEEDLQTSSERSRLFASRSTLVEMGNITFRKYRNKLFRVTSASSRPLEPSIYSCNLQLLDEVLANDQQKHIRTIIYLGPLRFIQPNPNSPQRIDQIRRDVAEIAGRRGAVLLDYTHLVPENDWTDYEPIRLNQLTGDAGQHDFAHFRAAAHRMVADRLFHDTDGVLTQPKH